ncbi:uncharacterized protein VP01_506g7 [Puccinia sorghi]|uniref:Photolyase/cryptochrome alpha/beta domain-containing protein n=1 Tax=Puccinia sorghi TaxID=27349 RepID=A0A0L6ULH1_9BASI|nr:uncharacterized protein VP01_506g7 [Puccinia sorghi]
MPTHKKRPIQEEEHTPRAKRNHTITSVQEETPYQQLLRLQNDHQPTTAGVEEDDPRDVVVYWMRMRDLRLADNRALAIASRFAKEHGKHLVVLHVLSPGDYRAHHRSPRRIDFLLRNLALLQLRLNARNIPLWTTSIEPRLDIPNKIIHLLNDWGTSYLTANIEHEVDELRRDIQVLKLARQHKIEIDFLHDTCLVEPGKVLTKENKPYSVFGPWQRNWANLINGNLDAYVAAAPDCLPNNPNIRENEALNKLFQCDVPSQLAGFELSPEDSQLLKQFLRAPMKRETNGQTFLSDKRGKGQQVEAAVQQYGTVRNRADLPGTSRLSAYLAAGVISPRACIRASFQASSDQAKKPSASHALQVEHRDSGIGVWQSELGWRDFYQHVLAAWPRVCMGKAFNQKYESVVWEKDEEVLEKWKHGMTGYPFVDACMRQLKHIGYMHNRGRMCVAMFLTKDLMMDWRLGEQWFMEHLVDGDLGSKWGFYECSNGGWQWSASTGTDAQPYFRIFAPLAQSEKADPEGTFIRQWVPELASNPGSADDQ